MKSKETLRLDALENAVKSLREGLARPPASELERDGVIQRFEYAFELAWKMIRQYPIVLGRAQVSGSPRPLLRDAFEEGLIFQLEQWFEFLEARNAASHNYSAISADQVYKVAAQFLPEVEKLLGNLKKGLGS